jgi:hypothetical protein
MQRNPLLIDPYQCTQECNAWWSFPNCLEKSGDLVQMTRAMAWTIATVRMEIDTGMEQPFNFAPLLEIMLAGGFEIFTHRVHFALAFWTDNPRLRVHEASYPFGKSTRTHLNPFQADNRIVTMMLKCLTPAF